jgi:hypothetical protein
MTIFSQARVFAWIAIGNCRHINFLAAIGAVANGRIRSTVVHIHAAFRLVVHARALPFRCALGALTLWTPGIGT